ncbi:hypothetical protein [Luteimonas abyssi]|uniref:hypothetical protein n=1 Tax=Luteimonas abyssi TaxID=1247514 RepID=UPI0012FBF580|nr:hypothetical protein [Luteimonas abyssi]
MFRTHLRCPHCRSEISLEEARSTIPAIPLPGQSTTLKKVSLVYTVCPKCRRDFQVKGERLAAFVILVVVFLLLGVSFFVDSLIPLALAAATLIFQKKIMQTLIRAAHA